MKSLRKSDNRPSDQEQVMDIPGAAPMKVFISYSRKDRDFVARVVDALEAADGIEVFRDTDDILPTEEWQERLDQLIREADTIVFALSPHSAKSEVCAWEVELAESLHKRFAPIVIRDVEGQDIPPALARLNYIFFTNKREFDASIGNLIAALNTDIGWIREHTRLGNLARRWDGGGRASISVLRGSDLTAAESWISSQPKNAPQPTPLHHAFIQASRKAATRRQRMTVGGALAAASIATVLAGYAVIQQRAAESALRTGTESANKLVFGLAERFKESSVPGRIIESILDEARGLQDELSANFPDDAELQRSKAWALIELGDVYKNLDDLSKAKTAYTQSLVIARRISANAPDKALWQRDIAVSLNRIGDADLRSGNTPSARKVYEESMAITRAIAAREPGNEKWQRDLSVDFEKLGNIKLQSGDVNGALASYGEGLKIVRSLADANPGNPTWQRDITVGLDKIGDTQINAGNVEAALAAFNEELQIARTLADRDADNTTWRRAVVIALNNVGRAQLASNNSQEALRAYSESLAIMRAIANTDPENTEWQRDISIGLHRLGDVQHDTGDASAALENFRESLRLARGLSARDPENALWLEDVAKVGERVGDALSATGDTARAHAAFADSAKIRRTLAERAPGNPDYERQLSAVLVKLGNMLELSSDLHAAQEAFSESATHLRGLLEDAPQDAGLKRDLSNALERTGTMAMFQENFGAARSSYRESLAILRGLAAENPDDASLQTAIAYHLFSISITSEDAGEKRRLLESIMDILNALLARDALPADFQAWPDLIREQLQELSAETIVQ
ncbi:MAG: TIR domain-containing protein [Rhodobiaceae bacterium]|nr:TIR domain-containing protein [Rhodobiaceae bacterium]